MILLHDLKGVAQFDCTKNMSVHVPTCTSYDFDTLMPVVRSSGEDKTFLHPITKISYHFLGQ